MPKSWKELVPKKAYCREHTDNQDYEDCIECDKQSSYNLCISDHEPLYKYVDKLEEEVRNDNIALGVLSTDFEVMKAKAEKLEKALDEIESLKSVSELVNETPGAGELQVVVQTMKAVARKARGWRDDRDTESDRYS